jgi:hypothetical protein
VLEVEGFLYDEEMLEDSSAEQLTREVSIPLPLPLPLIDMDADVLHATHDDTQELLEAVQLFVNDCQAVSE